MQFGNAVVVGVEPDVNLVDHYLLQGFGRAVYLFAVVIALARFFFGFFAHEHAQGIDSGLFIAPLDKLRTGDDLFFAYQFSFFDAVSAGADYERCARHGFKANIGLFHNAL